MAQCKILHLVLYSPADHYTKMMEATQPLYAAFNAHVTTFYYHCDSSLSTPSLDGMVLRLPGTETYNPGILNKTVDAFKFLLANYSEFDFVVRSNASTVINWHVFLPQLKLVRGSMYYGGTHIMTSEGLSGANAAKYASFLPLDFAQGTCIVLHKTAVEFIVANERLLNKELDDDPSIALLLKSQLEVFPKQIGTQYANFMDQFNVDSITAFRNHHFHSDRKEDVVNVQNATKTLRVRYDVIAKLNPRVLRVRYATMDITDKLILLCKVYTSFVINSNENGLLDDWFGDPCPGIVKQLEFDYMDEENQLAVFKQAAKLTFTLRTLDANTCQLHVY